MIDFEDYGLAPREFAILARMSITKMRKDPELALSRVDALTSELHEAGYSLGEWARKELVPGITPLTLWKKATEPPDLASLLDDPTAEVQRVFPTAQTTRDVEEQIRAWSHARNQGG